MTNGKDVRSAGCEGSEPTTYKIWYYYFFYFVLYFSNIITQKITFKLLKHVENWHSSSNIDI